MEKCTPTEAQVFVHGLSQFVTVQLLEETWRSFLESLYVNTTQIRNKWDCWKSSAQSKRRHLVQNKIFTWEKFVKKSWSRPESCIHRQLDGTWERMWDFITESPHFNTSSIWDKRHRWKSRSTSKRRYVSSIATVRTGWKVVVRLYGMLLLSARCPRPPERWENAIRKTIWRTILRANNTCWSNGWISSVFTERSVDNSSIWHESSTWNRSWLWTDRGVNLERRYLDSRPGRFGKFGCIRCLSSKNQSKGSIDQSKRWGIHISNRRWYSKIVRRRPRIPRNHSKAGTTCKEWRSQWRTSRKLGEVFNRQKPTDDAEAHADFWSIQADFIYREGRNIPNSTEIHWCY